MITVVGIWQHLYAFCSLRFPHLSISRLTILCLSRGRQIKKIHGDNGAQRNYPRVYGVLRRATACAGECLGDVPRIQSLCRDRDGLRHQGKKKKECVEDHLLDHARGYWQGATWRRYSCTNSAADKVGRFLFWGGAHVSRKHNADDVTTQQAGCIRFKDENGYLGTVPRPAASQNTLVYYCIFPFLRMPLERERTNNRRVCNSCWI